MTKSERPSILIADDEPAIRETAAFIFKQHGFKVFTASNGKEALKMIRQERPKMALLDIRMPEGEGPEICARIKRDPHLKDTFVVILTSDTEEVNRKWAINEGANAFLTKPFHEKEIMGLVRQALSEN